MVDIHLNRLGCILAFGIITVKQTIFDSPVLIDVEARRIAAVSGIVILDDGAVDNGSDAIGQNARNAAAGCRISLDQQVGYLRISIEAYTAGIL